MNQLEPPHGRPDRATPANVSHPDPIYCCLVQIGQHGNTTERWYWPVEVLNFDIDTVTNMECNILRLKATDRAQRDCVLGP